LEDAETEGWTVINSLRGGCRRWNQDEKGLDINEVLSLAKKQWKFTVSGPAIGGAKSGINFDPNDPRKKAFYNVGTKRYLHY
jgi:glutamate dehydrogenase/leucine dehydrogenase